MSQAQCCLLRIYNTQEQGTVSSPKEPPSAMGATGNTQKVLNKGVKWKNGIVHIWTNYHSATDVCYSRAMYRCNWNTEKGETKFPLIKG